MTEFALESAWRPLGKGRMAPAGSLADAARAARLAAYKHHVAGNYRALAPAEIMSALPVGPCVVSEKIDGETWFLVATENHVVLASPNGKVIERVPVTDEGSALLRGWTGVLAGELYAHREGKRARVHDIAAVLGGGADADIARLRFAAFDVLDDGGSDMQRNVATERLARMEQLLAKGQCLRYVPHEIAHTPDAVSECFERWVVRGGAEGIVVQAPGGRIYKIKPEITLDACVVAYGESAQGVSELLLALLDADGTFQLIGRVRTGWSRAESAALAVDLSALACGSQYRKTTDHGTLCRWVAPRVVVEIRCHDLLVENSRAEPIRRMALGHDESVGWVPHGRSPSVSLINAVFTRRRGDKGARRPDVRLEQVTDLVAVATRPALPTRLPPAEIIGREVYTKAGKAGVAVRKVVVIKTNKREADVRHPAFAVHFTDFSSSRKEPLSTDIALAATESRAFAVAANWLREHIKAGWTLVPSQMPIPVHEPRDDACAALDASATIGQSEPPVLTLAFPRSSSLMFESVRQRTEALSKLGTWNVSIDARGRESWFELRILRGAVEHLGRVASIIDGIHRWKSSEILVQDEHLGPRELDEFLHRMRGVRACYLKHRERGSEGCARDCALACDRLRLRASVDDLPGHVDAKPAWFAVGRFDGERVHIDKAELEKQVLGPSNVEAHFCPNYDPARARDKIAALPVELAANGEHWVAIRQPHAERSAWLWPAHVRPPPGFVPAASESTDGVRVVLNGDADAGEREESTTAGAVFAAAAYAQVHGQDDAVAAVRDAVELPLKHGELFHRLGSTPRASGLILAGPPGTGKSLLARAVASECGAHLETVSGPELLSKWQGESESALRGIFARARARAPALILFDEIDGLASAREDGDSEGQRALVTQLLVLLDGLNERGQVFVIATTNRPEAIDPALRRPGRFDQIIWMRPPDYAGRLALFRHHLLSLVLAPGVDHEDLAHELAARTPGATGAMVAALCQRAVLLRVKEAAASSQADDIALEREHFLRAVKECEAGDVGLPRATTATETDWSPGITGSPLRVVFPQ